MWNVEPVERVRRKAGSETDRGWETEEIYLKHFIELTLGIGMTPQKADVYNKISCGNETYYYCTLSLEI